MVSKHSNLFIFIYRIPRALAGSKGISLMFIVFLMLMLSVSFIGLLTFGAKLRAIEKDSITLERLDSVKEALQRYFLSYHNLPEPFIINQSKTIPAEALNLPQEYRFDSSGEFIHYDWQPLDNDTEKVDINGLEVRETEVAAVLVASGPDKMISDSNLENPYADPDEAANDDIVVAISLNAEAIKIATRTVGILQAAAKAYDYQIYRSANDGKTVYRLLRIPDFYDPDNPPVQINVRYISETRSARAKDGLVAVTGGNGAGCVRYGRLENDPDRGIHSLDLCPVGQASQDIVDVYGLNGRHKTDPWGTFYQWGSSLNYMESDRRYWNFFSMGPDKTANTNDDITPTTDIIERVLPLITVPDLFLQSTNTVAEPID